MHTQNRKSHFTVIVAVSCLMFVFGCNTPDSFPRHHHVGNVYEVVGNLCIVNDLLKDEEMGDIAGWQSHAEKFGKHFEKLPPGTKIKIASIEKVTSTSWNNGTYSYYIVIVNVLTPGHEEVRYNATTLIYGVHGERFGDNGSNLVTLKLVSDAKQK